MGAVLNYLPSIRNPLILMGKPFPSNEALLCKIYNLNLFQKPLSTWAENANPLKSDCEAVCVRANLISSDLP